jgi:transcriptional regulator with XRE-family HTH domain
MKMTNDQKLEKLVSTDKSGWKESAEWRRANRGWLKKSGKIAFRILEALDAKEMTQKELAEAMGVTPQQVNKIVKGKENLSLKTIEKLEQTLGISLISFPSVITVHKGIQIEPDYWGGFSMPDYHAYASKEVSDKWDEIPEGDYLETAS